MTEDDLKRFVEGLLTAWSVTATVTAEPAADGLAVCVDQHGARLCQVSRRVTGFGAAWRIEAPGRRARTHPSAQGAIRSLGDILAPSRSIARVAFASGLGGAQ